MYRFFCRPAPEPDKRGSQELNPPADDAALAERLGRARAFLTRNPIELRPNHGLVEISGF